MQERRKLILRAKRKGKKKAVHDCSTPLHIEPQKTIRSSGSLIESGKTPYSQDPENVSVALFF